MKNPASWDRKIDVLPVFFSLPPQPLTLFASAPAMTAVMMVVKMTTTVWDLIGVARSVEWLSRFLLHNSQSKNNKPLDIRKRFSPFHHGATEDE